MGETGYAGKQSINFSILLSDFQLPASSICCGGVLMSWFLLVATLTGIMDTAGYGLETQVAASRRCCLCMC